MTRRRTLSFIPAALIAATLAAATPAVAEDGSGGTIRVEKPWARATPGRAVNGAAYFTLHNVGPGADRLIAVSTPVARRASLHSQSMKGGIMRMRSLDSVDLPAGGGVSFKPGGRHVMLMGLESPLKQGARFPLTLTFARAGKVTLEVPVMGVGAMGPGKGGGNRATDSRRHK